jgi:uncharacterized protein YbcI
VTDGESAPSSEDVIAEIEAEILRVHEDSYGTGASAITAHISGDTVLVVIDVELTAAERTLLTAGHDEAVKVTREAFQLAIAPTFAAIIERATGRQVRSFISAMSTEQLYSIEFFRLEAH